MERTDNSEDKDPSESESPSQGPAFKPKKRPRGLLSHTDREYLCGLKEYEWDQSELKRRQEIHDRVFHGLQDFRLLWWSLDEEARDRIFEELEENYETPLRETLSSVVSFLYLGLNQDENHLADIIESGVYSGSNHDKDGKWGGGADNVDVSIDIEYKPNIDAIYDRFEQGKELTPTEIGVLVQAGKISEGDLDRLRDTTSTYLGINVGGLLIPYENEDEKIED